MSIEDYHNLAYWGDDDPDPPSSREDERDRKRMSEIWKPLSRETYQQWIHQIMEEASDELTVWEIDFIENVDSWLTSGKDLTQRQAEVLERIYARKTK